MKVKELMALLAEADGEALVAALALFAAVVWLLLRHEKANRAEYRKQFGECWTCGYWKIACRAEPPAHECDDPRNPANE